MANGESSAAPKALGAVTLLLALIGGLVAVMEPLKQRIEFIEDYQVERRAWVSSHVDRHFEIARELAALGTEQDSYKMPSEITARIDSVMSAAEKLIALVAGMESRLAAIELRLEVIAPRVSSQRD